MGWVVKVRDRTRKGLVNRGDYPTKTKTQAMQLARDAVDLLRRNPHAHALGYCPSGSAESGAYSLRPDGKASIRIEER